MCSVNGRDEADHVDTPRPMQHKSTVAQSSASASHDVKSSATVSSSRPTSGRLCQLASSDVSSTAVGPASSPQSRLSHVETPFDAVTSLHSIQHETDRSLSEESLKSHQGDLLRHKSNVQSSLKTSVTRDSPPSVTASHDRPKPSRLVVLSLMKNTDITQQFFYEF